MAILPPYEEQEYLNKENAFGILNVLILSSFPLCCCFIIFFLFLLFSFLNKFKFTREEILFTMLKLLFLVCMEYI